MITNDHFTFIHMHKTGGQTLSNLLSLIKSSREVGYHYPISELPAYAKDRPIVGMVRNPWSWYVSWYAFNAAMEIKTPLFTVLSHAANADMRTTLVNLINLGSDADVSRFHRKALIDILPDTLEGNRGPGLTKASIKDLEASGKGYYSWLFERMHGDLHNPNLYIGRFENLQGDFINIMKELSVPETPQMEASFAKVGHLNSSRHSHYSNYYDEDLKNLVAEKDALIVDLYDYSFEESYVDEPIPLAYERYKNFKKLKGSTDNFLLITDGYDVAELRDKVLAIPEAAWHKSGREKKFEAHRDTNSLLVIHDEDFRHFKPTYRPLYDELKEQLSPIFELVKEYYGGDGYFVRALIARLKPGGFITPHIDTGYTLQHCNRVHIPLVSDEGNSFSVGGEEKHLKVGEIWEINNASVHSVKNDSDNTRIHLIIDWVDPSTIRIEDRAMVAQLEMRNAANQSHAMKADNAKRIGRNEPCPCGSGKKYKRCHG